MRRSGTSEHGGVAPEFVGVALLVAALVAVVLIVALPDRVGEAADVATDCLFTDGDCALPDAGSGRVADVATPASATGEESIGTVPSDDPGVQAALDAIDDAGHPPWHRIPRWRRGDAERVADLMTELSGPQLNTLIAELDDDQLRELFVTLGRLSETDRRALLAHVGERVGRGTWRRLGAFTDEIDPDPATALADTARDEADRDERAWYDDLEYAPFDGELAERGPGDEHALADTDFAQGAIGDCYLITAMLAIIYEDPDLLASRIVENPNGTYTVTFADGTPVVVSPEFAVHPDHPDSPAFANDVGQDAAPGTELYPLVIEKAYAQYHGGWEDIVGGWPAETMQEIVGGSFDTVDHESVTVRDVRDWTTSGRPVTIGTYADPRDEGEREYPDDHPEPYVDGRLAHNHAYVVTEVDPDTEEVLLVNPWHPSRDPVRLTIDEFQSAIRRVDVSRLP